MNFARRTAAVALGVGLIFGAVAPAAGAADCATWYREGHDPDHNGHSSDHSSPEADRDLGPVYFHNHSGHYVVRGNGFYVEIIGGGYYDGNGVAYTNQGGAVQAGVTPNQLLPVPVDGDINANVNLFASGKAGACVSALGNKIGEQGRDPQH